MIERSVSVVLLLSVLVACGGSRRPSDDAGPTPPTDTGTAPRDTGGTPPTDTGGSGDPCATDAAGSAANAGCHGGFVSAMPAANAPGGTCTGDAAGGQGTCTGAGICSGGDGMPGFCFAACTAGATYVSTSTCPTGFRCFDLDQDLCFRDCDATHACPTGMMCDGEGSCVPAM